MWRSVLRPQRIALFNSPFQIQRGLHERNKKAKEYIGKGWSALHEVGRVVPYTDPDDELLTPLLKTAQQNFEMALEVDNLNTQARLWLGLLHLKYCVPGACRSVGVSLLREAADMGNADAQYELACQLRAVQGPVNTVKQAFYYLSKAVDQLQPEALFLLGAIYLGGESLQKDVEKAASCFHKASQKGHVGAAIAYGALILQEQWRQVCTYNSSYPAHSGGVKDQYRVLRCLSVSGYMALVLGVGIQNSVAKEVAETETDGGMNGSKEAYASEGSLRSINYGEFISNAHTERWRDFTNKGQKAFLEGNLDEAENYFLLALEEAKKGFGLLDPHVASAYNNLAELYRMKKMFEKAEPLYLEAIELLEVTLGPEDMRVGLALHNLGGFYLMQHKLEQARTCYERALKIKRHILGLNHPDYANTMFHLGEVLRLQGNLGDAEVLFRDSIRILEEGRLGQSQLIIKRMGKLAQILLETNKLEEAEKVQRKILHIFEVSKGWDSLNTVAAAEQLALTIQSLGNLDEAEELLQRCLEVKRNRLPENHIQIAATMLKLARVVMLKASRHKMVNASEAELELEKAKGLLNDAIRIADISKQLSVDAISNDRTTNEIPSKEEKDAQEALIILMQSWDALGLLETSILELHRAGQKLDDITKGEEAARNCISALKQPGIPEKIVKSDLIKREYLSCLQRLAPLLAKTSVNRKKEVKEELRQLNREIIQIEEDLGLRRRKRWFF